MCNKISVLQNAHINIHIHIALNVLNMLIIFIKIYEIYEMYEKRTNEILLCFYDLSKTKLAYNDFKSYNRRVLNSSEFIKN